MCSFLIFTFNYRKQNINRFLREAEIIFKWTATLHVDIFVILLLEDAATLSGFVFRRFATLNIQFAVAEVTWRYG